MNTERTIDIPKLRAQFAKYDQSSTLDEAEALGAILDAIEAWEHCGGRSLQAFHSLVDTAEFLLSHP